MKHADILLTLLAVGLLACGGTAGAEGGGDANQAGGHVEGGAAAVGGGGSGAGGGAEGGAAACSAPPAPMTFELGTGEDCFARIEDGDVLPLIAGPQGGYHVWVAFGCEDCPTALRASFGVSDVETGMPLPNTYDTEVIADLEGEPFRQLAGLVLRTPGVSWDPEGFPPPAQGSRILIWAELLDDNGEAVQREEREIEIGETVEWNPCKEEPELPECQFG